MEVKEIPETILTAASGMLAPFGINLKLLLQVDQSRRNEQQKQKYLSVAEVEANYGLRRWSLYRRIKEGVVKAVKLADARSGKVLVDRESLDMYFSQHTQTMKGANNAQ